MSPGSIMSIFLVQGAFVGVLGTLLGTVCGVALSLNVETIVRGIEALFQTSFIAADVYFISELPSQLLWSDVIMVSSASLVPGAVVHRVSGVARLARAAGRGAALRMNARKQHDKTVLTVLACEGLKKTYEEGPIEVEVLKGVALSVAHTERIAIVGASGSGKEHAVARTRRPSTSPAPGV